MSCTPETSDKLEKLLSFLGLILCWECKGSGRVEIINCSCCQPEFESCSECKAEGFIVHDYSPLKNLLDDNNGDSEEIGLCD